MSHCLIAEHSKQSWLQATIRCDCWYSSGPAGWFCWPLLWPGSPVPYSVTSHGAAWLVHVEETVFLEKGGSSLGTGTVSVTRVTVHPSRHITRPPTFKREQFFLLMAEITMSRFKEVQRQDVITVNITNASRRALYSWCQLLLITHNGHHASPRKECPDLGDFWALAQSRASGRAGNESSELNCLIVNPMDSWTHILSFL